MTEDDTTDIVTQSNSSLNELERLIAGRDGNRTRFGRLGVSTTNTAALDKKNREWLNDIGVSPECVITMFRIRREYRATERRLFGFVEQRDGLRILQRLTEQRTGVTYDELSERVDISSRHLRRRVKRLVDLNVVEREGNPAHIRFVDQDRYILAVEVAHTPPVD